MEKGQNLPHNIDETNTDSLNSSTHTYKKKSVKDLPPKTIKKIEKLLTDRVYTRRQIAEQYGVTYNSVVLYFRGVRKSLPLVDIEYIKKFLESGKYTRKEIARMYNLSASYLYTITNGIKAKKNAIGNLTNEQYQGLLDDLQSGLFTVRELSSKYAISHTTIHKHAKKVEVNLRRERRLSPEAIEELNRFYDSGNYSLTSLAKRFKVSKNGLYLFLKNYKKRKKQLSDDEISEMRFLLMNEKFTKEELSIKYEVSLQTVQKYTKDIKNVKRKKRKHLSTEEIVELKELLKDQRLTRREIAERFDIAERTVGSYVDHTTRKNHGRPSVVPPDQVDIMKSLLKRGEFTRKELAKKYGVAVSTVQIYTKGVPAPKRKEKVQMIEVFGDKKQEGSLVGTTLEYSDKGNFSFDMAN